jgi:hypothetical protein
MYWVKVKWLDPLFAAFNHVWPARQRAQDGTIGDAAHMTGVSGHNPDDTPGVQAERQDADTTPEVRAGDVDARGVDMERAVQAVLHGPAAERDRLIYIIFNHRIWRKANGWRQETYTRDDPHDTHAHFSGDPAADENSAPWTSILNLLEEPDMEQSEKVTPATPDNNSVGDALNIAVQVRRILADNDSASGYGTPKPGSFMGKVYAAFTALAAKVDAITTEPISQEAVDAAVRTALADPAVVGPLVKAINDDAARRAAE